MVVPPSLKFTEPVGIGPGPLTVAVNITVPYTEGLAEGATTVVEPGPVETRNIPVPVKRLLVCCAPELGEPHVPGALKVAPPSNDSALIVLGAPANARFTSGAAPFKSKFFEELI